MKNNKRKKVLIIIGVVLLIAAALGITYAYFLGKIGPNKTVNITSTSNTTDELTFDTGGILRINPNQQNAATPGNNISATTTASAKLVANNNTNSATYNYFLYLDITSNNYIYTTGATATPELVLTVTNPAGQEVTSIPGLTHVSSPVSGFDVTTKTGLIRISENNPITATSTSTTQNWTFKLTFVNLTTNQKLNAGKTFSSILKIQKEEIVQTFAETLIVNNGTIGMDHHTATLANGANDGSYRFSGANPNNYVCFGPGATAAGTACPDNNLYRIIGVFGNQVKLIKKTSLGNKAWNSSNVNTWAGSTMDTYLNGEYLNSLTSTWSNKIASSTWQVGGLTGANRDQVPSIAYNYEVGPNKANVTFNGKIGLMYISDYGFAASSSFWTNTLYNYEPSKASDWLNINIHEWTMSRSSDLSSSVFNVYSTGCVDSTNANIAYGVRPSFNLESFINLNGGNGSAIDPYRI